MTSTQKFKVFHVTVTHTRKGVGGIQSFISMFHRGLRKAKIGSEIVSVYSITGDTLKFFRIPLLGIVPYRLVLSFLSALAFCVRNRGEHYIIHAHDMTFGGLTGLLIKFFSRMPLVVTDHGIQSATETYRYVKSHGNTSLSHLNAIFLLFLERIVVIHADKIIHVNEYTYDYYLRQGANPAKMKTVRNGINLDTFRPKRPIFSENPVRMLYAGRISSEKGVNALIKVFSLLEKSHQNIRLLIVGEGSDEKKIRKMAGELGIRGVDFLPTVQRGLMEKFYNDSDIVVVPSVLETGTPLALLEAMACERLVIINSAGSLPSIMGNAGLKVGFNNPSEAAILISSMLNDKRTARKLARLARERAMEYFNWNSCFNQILDIYVKQLSSRGWH